MQKHNYDIGIVGGGLAGLSLSILMARKGFSVVLFEKERYPFHRVCGEYISNESRYFIQELGVDTSALPSISQLMLTSVSGQPVYADLPLGGFGISRYMLDNELQKVALDAGVYIYQGTRVDDIQFKEGSYRIVGNAGGNSIGFSVKACCGAFGKRSNLDVKWNRQFLQKQDKRLNNYVGVKYHIRTLWPRHLIGLHNFSNGYCGISEIEEGKYCLCYMAQADDLKKFNGDLSAYQESVLYENPYLRNIFTTSTILPGFPVTIAQINFQEKEMVENEVLMIGDAAGMITPLCGNGMSIAFHSALIASQSLEAYLTGQLNLKQAQQLYVHNWKKQFSKRMVAGRLLQRLFGKPSRSNNFIRLLRLLPFLKGTIIRLTHGRPFYNGHIFV